MLPPVRLLSKLNQNQKIWSKHQDLAPNFNCTVKVVMASFILPPYLLTLQCEAGACCHPTCYMPLIFPIWQSSMRIICLLVLWNAFLSVAVARVSAEVHSDTINSLLRPRFLFVTVSSSNWPCYVTQSIQTSFLIELGIKTDQVTTPGVPSADLDWLTWLLI